MAGGVGGGSWSPGRVCWCNVSILGTHLRHTKVIKHCSMTFTTVISLLDTGFVIPPCQPQNRANDMTSQNILYLMNHRLDWCQYRLKLKPTYYSIIHEFLLIFQLYLTALLINLFSIAKHWHGFEGYCTTNPLSRCRTILPRCHLRRQERRIWPCTQRRKSLSPNRNPLLLPTQSLCT